MKTPIAALEALPGWSIFYMQDLAYFPKGSIIVSDKKPNPSNPFTTAKDQYKSHQFTWDTGRYAVYIKDELFIPDMLKVPDAKQGVDLDEFPEPEEELPEPAQKKEIKLPEMADYEIVALSTGAILLEHDRVIYLPTHTFDKPASVIQVPGWAGKTLYGCFGVKQAKAYRYKPKRQMHPVFSKPHPFFLEDAK